MKVQVKFSAPRYGSRDEYIGRDVWVEEYPSVEAAEAAVAEVNAEPYSELRATVVGAESPRSLAYTDADIPF